MSYVNETMWRTQNVLHKQPQIMPVMMLLASSSLVVYRHMTHSGVTVLDPSGEHDFLKKFLAMILLQMVPLVVLEMKIMQCSDPVGLFCQFATPVTLTHACFQAIRIGLGSETDPMTYWSSCAGLVIAVVVMMKGYKQSFSRIMQCYSVWGLIALAIFAGVATHALDGALDSIFMTPENDFANDADGMQLEWDGGSQFSWRPFMVDVLWTSNNYIEIVAFVPAVWTVFSEDRSGDRFHIESTETKRTATAFFLFLIGFYVTEDLYNAWEAYTSLNLPLAAMSHVLHFLLLVDFGCYVLAHIYNPGKLVGEQLRKWLPVDFSHEV